MISFIMQEAKEKAEDIRRDTEKDFNADKLNKERALNMSLKEEFAKKKR